MKLLLPFFRVAITGAAGLLLGCSPKMGATLATTELSAALPAGTPYALVHLYRPSRLVGFAIGYDVRLNDSVVYRARNGSQGTIRRMKAGPAILSAKTEAHSELPLDLQPGREYYVRCSLDMGAVVGHPQLTQVSVAEGKQGVARAASEAAASKSSPND